MKHKIAMRSKILRVLLDTGRFEGEEYKTLDVADDIINEMVNYRQFERVPAFQLKYYTLPQIRVCPEFAEYKYQIIHLNKNGLIEIENTNDKAYADKKYQKYVVDANRLYINGMKEIESIRISRLKYNKNAQRLKKVCPEIKDNQLIALNDNDIEMLLKVYDITNKKRYVKGWFTSIKETKKK